MSTLVLGLPNLRGLAEFPYECREDVLIIVIHIHTHILISSLVQLLWLQCEILWNLFQKTTVLLHSSNIWEGLFHELLKWHFHYSQAQPQMAPSPVSSTAGVLFCFRGKHSRLTPLENIVLVYVEKAEYMQSILQCFVVRVAAYPKGKLSTEDSDQILSLFQLTFTFIF